MTAENNGYRTDGADLRVGNLDVHSRGFRWRQVRFGGGIELVKRRPGGGSAIWAGSVTPGCCWQTQSGVGEAGTWEAAKAEVEKAALVGGAGA